MENSIIIYGIQVYYWGFKYNVGDSYTTRGIQVSRGAFNYIVADSSIRWGVQVYAYGDSSIM